MARKKFCEMCEKPVTPAKDGDCPECGGGLVTIPKGVKLEDLK